MASLFFGENIWEGKKYVYKDKIIITCIGVLYFHACFLPIEAKAAHRVAGDTFIGIDEGTEYEYKVLTPATDNTLGTVCLMGVTEDSRQIDISDTVEPFSSIYVSKDYGDEEYKIVSIAPSAFENNTNIVHVSFKSKSYVTTIPQNCFAGCKSLQTVDSFNVKNIDESAFLGCSKLNHVFCGKKLKMIGPNAFKDCKKLSYFSVDSKLKSVGKNAFKNTAKRFTVFTNKRKNCVLIKKARGNKKVRFWQSRKPTEIV